MSRPTRRVLAALSVFTLVTGLATVQTADAYMEDDGGVVAVSGGCPAGQSYQNIWCATHQTHEQTCLPSS